jgi:hypothetical protein
MKRLTGARRVGGLPKALMKSLVRPAFAASNKLRAGTKK